MSEPLRLSADHYSHGDGAYPTNGHDAPEREPMDLSRLLHILRRHWLIVVVVAAVVLALAAYNTFSQDFQYETSSVILVEQSGAQRGGGGINEVISFQLGNRGLNNEIAILRESLTLAERVAARMAAEGVTGPAMRNAEGGALPLEWVARRARGQVRFAAPENQTDIIRITAVSTDPAEAAAIANSYAEEYRIQNQEASRESVTGALSFLEEQEQAQRRQLEQVEAEIQNFIAQHGAVALDTEAENTVSRLATLDAELDQTRLDIQMQRDALRQVEEEIERVQPGLTRRLASSYEGEAAALQGQIAQLEVQITHFYVVNPALRGNEQSEPELARLMQQTALLRERVVELTQRRVEDVMEAGTAGSSGVDYLTQLQREMVQKRSTIGGLEARAGSLQRQLASQESRLQTIPRHSIQLAQLQRQRQAYSVTYNFLFNKLQEARLVEQSQFGNVHIVRRADVPGRPVRPNRRKDLLNGLMLGLMLGVGSALLRGILDRRVRTPEDLQAAGFSVLGTVPEFRPLIRSNFDGAERVTLGDRKVDSSVALGLHPLSPVTEAMRRIRTNIRFSSPDRKLKVIQVTSSEPSEGKTAMATNLAISMATAGLKTLLVDADLRRPAVHKRFGLENEKGLASLLFLKPEVVDWEPFRMRLSAQWDDFDLQIQNLFVVTSGPRVPNPAELLQSRRMGELVVRMRESFDVVIFDTPPALAVTDPILVSALADGVILVANTSSSDVRALEHTRDQIVQTSTPVLGVVLNRYTRTRTAGYGYGYSYGYGYGYGATDKFAAPGKGKAKAGSRRTATPA